MKLETAAKLLQSLGIEDPTQILQRLMKSPIASYTTKHDNPLCKILQQYQIVAEDGLLYVQGVSYTRQQALDFLIERRGISDVDALRVIALALDLERLSK